VLPWKEARLQDKVKLETFPQFLSVFNCSYPQPGWNVDLFDVRPFSSKVSNADETFNCPTTVVDCVSLWVCVLC